MRVRSGIAALPDGAGPAEARQGLPGLFEPSLPERRPKADNRELAKMRNLLTTFFVFKGRIGRRRYWSLTLLYMSALVMGMAAFIATGILLDAKSTDAFIFVPVGIGVVFFGSMSAAISGIAVRRLHDRGKTGYWLMLYFFAPSWLIKHADIEGAGLVFLAAALGAVIWAVVDLGVLRGQAGSNAFGPDPLLPADGFDTAVAAEI
jgi:uncharacterized membrane protein YhaH (DUF805 family)